MTIYDPVTIYDSVTIYDPVTIYDSVTICDSVTIIDNPIDNKPGEFMLIELIVWIYRYFFSHPTIDILLYTEALRLDGNASAQFHVFTIPLLTVNWTIKSKPKVA